MRYTTARDMCMPCEGCFSDVIRYTKYERRNTKYEIRHMKYEIRSTQYEIRKSQTNQKNEKH